MIFKKLSNPFRSTIYMRHYFPVVEVSRPHSIGRALSLSPLSLSLSIRIYIYIDTDLNLLQGLASMASLGVSGLVLGLTMVMVMLISPAHSLNCTSQTFANNKLYAHCNDLSQLNSFLHWNYNSTNSSISIAFIAPPAKSGGWISWAINPTGTKMIGSQAFIAFKDSNDTMTVKTYNLTSYKSINQSKLSFDVWDMSAESSAGGLMRIFASMKVPEKATTVNQVWQVGSIVTDDMPVKHEFKPANLNAFGTLDLEKGQSNNNTGTGGSSRAEKKNIHGILNAVSWGILFPVGVIIARYLRTFQFADPAWFYLHIFCQLSAYALGVAGWATGLKLGSESKGVQFTGHRNIGIALFSLATVQIFALFLRPKKDHKYRTYWNVYHHSVGYAILVLGIINVFKGLDILDPAKKWKSAYIVVIAALGLIASLLEAITWIVILKKKKSDKSTKPHDGFNE